MKKILSLVLAMLMIISMVPAVFAAETSESDYQAAIEYLKAIDLYKGTTDGDAADELVERYQMALFTARMVTGRVDKAYWETDANDSKFTDLEALNAEALGGVCYAAQQGIVNGIGGNEFAPFDNVTYRDAIVMIVRALGFNYPDSGYPWSYVNKARELGVLDGITGVSYTAEVKREVIAQLLYNAINAEIKGATIAASVFGVEETIVMVTATPDGIVYKADGTASVKANTVRVSAVDAAGEPIGAEYYVPFKALGLKNPSAANAAVGAYFKLTHKGNFSNFLACESLTQVFENTVDKKEVKYSSNVLTLGKDSYLVLSAGSDYTGLNNNQGTVSGNKEIKVFKAWGANNATTVGNTGYYLGTDGKVYSYENPFTPYAIYSNITKSWFIVTVNNHGAYTYAPATDDQVKAMLATIGGTVKGFSEIGRDGYINTRINANYGVDYDYYKAFATDTDGDGEFERVTVRAYRLYHFEKGTRKGVQDGSKTDIDTFTLTQFGANESAYNFAAEEDVTILVGTDTKTTFDAEYSEDTKYDVYFRFTGIAYNKLPAEGIIVAYLNTGVGSEKEIEVVDVADKMSAYIRGYDQASDSIIYGSDYETMKLGYFGVAGTSIYRATQCASKFVGDWKVKSANYVRNFWNKYVDLYVLNDSVVYIDDTAAADDYVILESYTGFSEEGLTAVAYSTKAGGKTEILINELNGWQLGGFDYALYEEMLRLQALLGSLVQVPTLPVQLNTVYAVRYVDENGAYNLVAPKAPAEDKEIYINNYGYIIGVNKDGQFAAGNRVATSDKDLWFILALDEMKVYSFQGKLAAFHLTDANFYKAKNNQFVLVVDNAAQLGAILGNSMDGIEYHMYNTAIDNEYSNKNIFGTYYYGHAMLNMRTGNVEFITYDAKLAAELNAAGKWFEGQYIHLTNGDIFQTIGGVLKNVVNKYGIADVAALDFAKGTYEGKAPAKVAVGAVLPANVALTDIPGNVSAAYTSYDALVAAITDTLYEGVYNRDFHQGNVSYQNAIKLELAHNVTFVGLGDDGNRTTWKAAKDGSYVAATLGSSTHIAYAYVMYDFANAKAVVYFDQDNLVELVNNSTVAATLGGVAASVTYASNVLKGETDVTINLSKPLLNPAVTLDGTAPAGAVITSNCITFTVNAANFADTTKITVTGTVVNKIAGVIPTDDTLGMANETDCGDPCKNDAYVDYWDFNGADGLVNVKVDAAYAPLTALFDGKIASAAGADLKDKATTVRLNGICLVHKHNFETFKRLDHVNGAGYPANDKTGFVSAVIAELPAAQTVKLARVYIPDDKTTATHYAVVNKSYAIMVSSDGVNWKLANTLENVWDDTNGYVNNKVILGAATDTTNKYLCVEFELKDVPADTKYVAVGFCDKSGWGWSYTSSDWNLSEIEFYN